MAEEKNTPAPAQEDNSAELASLKAENASLKAGILVLEGEKTELLNQVAEQDAIIAELQAQLEKAGTPIVSAHPVVAVGKDKYQVTLKQFRFKGTEYKAADLAKHPAVIKQLLEAKVEFLVKL